MGLLLENPGACRLLRSDTGTGHHGLRMPMGTGSVRHHSGQSMVGAGLT